MLDLMTVSNNLEELLKKDGYCGDRIGSGCTTVGTPIRDFQYFYGANKKKKITEDILNELLLKAENADVEGYDYGVKLKLRDNNFSVYVERITVDKKPCETKKVSAHLQIDSSALVDTIVTLFKDKRVSKLTIWDSSIGFDTAFDIDISDELVEKVDEE